MCVDSGGAVRPSLAYQAFLKGAATEKNFLKRVGEGIERGVTRQGVYMVGRQQRLLILRRS